MLKNKDSKSWKNYSDSRIALLVFFLFLTFYVLTSGGHPYYDEHMAFEVTKRLVEIGRLDVTEDSIQDYWEGSFRIGVDGKLHSIFSPGWSLSLLPFALLAKFFSLNSLTWIFYNSIAVALLCSLLYLFSRKIGVSISHSFILVLLFGLTTTSWQYSKTGTAVVWSSCFLLASIYFLYHHKNQESKKWYILSGILMSLSVLTRYDSAIFIPFVIAFLLINSKNNSAIKKISLFLIPIFISAGFVMLYNYFIWGSILETGYGHFGQLAMHNTFNGLVGLLVSPYTGLFLFAPVTILFFVAYRDFYKKERALSLLFISIFIISLLFYGTLSFWHGGHSWGPRYMFLTIPFLIITIGMSLNRKWFLMITMTLGAVGFFINMLGTLFLSQSAVSKAHSLGEEGWFDPSHSTLLYQIQMALENRWDLYFFQANNWLATIIIMMILAFEIWIFFKIIIAKN